MSWEGLGSLLGSLWGSWNAQQFDFRVGILTEIANSSQAQNTGNYRLKTSFLRASPKTRVEKRENQKSGKLDKFVLPTHLQEL